MKPVLADKKYPQKIQKGFTLFELLITISVVAVVMTITVVTLNPLEYLRRARDAKRISDLTNLQLALQLISTDKTISMGTCDGTKIYASVPSETPLSNDNLPAGISWVQTSQDNLMKNDGTGWIPIDFKSFSSKGIQLPALPIDPKNSANDYLFYTYTCNSNRQFVLTAWFESTAFGPQSQDPKSKNDNGPDPYLYEVGSNLFIHPLKPMGYWSFDEGIDTTAYDYSGNKNNGALYNGSQWVDGKMGKALSFDGVDDFVYIGNNASLNFGTGDFTLEAWFYMPSLPSAWKSIINKGGSGATGYGMEISSNNKITASIQGIGGTNQHVQSSNVPSIGIWHHAVCVFDRDDKIYIYLDGAVNISATYADGNTNSVDNTAAFNIGRYTSGTWYFNGLIDEVIIYNRALSAAEINRHYQLIK